jgi:hypothetical protein
MPPWKMAFGGWRALHALFERRKGRRQANTCVARAIWGYFNYIK